MNNQLTWQTFLFLIFIIASSNSRSAPEVQTEPVLSQATKQQPLKNQSGANPQCAQIDNATLLKKMIELQKLQAEILRLQQQLHKNQRKPIIFLPPAY